MNGRFRVERDYLGEKPVPIDALYGVQTVRAKENFPISNIPPKKIFIVSTAIIKKAACSANLSLGLIPEKPALAIIRAADEIITGKHHGQFIVDAYQAGAGTSHNMNMNEVLANRALELLGRKKGDYRMVHPNDHVNMNQSTNDVFPTSMRIAALFESQRLLKNLKKLESELRKKSREFKGIIKSGRTHLQDAIPVTLGQEFGSYAAAISKAISNIEEARDRFKSIGLGATAAGTGMNTHPRYRKTVLKYLSEYSGLKKLRAAKDYFEALNSMGDFAAFSSVLKNTSLELARISNDLRLLSSGPATGLSEINLPALQPGSSIMPGKVNPVMPEMLTMVCFQVIGNDLAVSYATQAGQLELNVMGPVINHNILQSIEILSNAIDAFTEKCVVGIKANKKKCEEYFERSVGLATALNPFIGYENAAQIAKEAIASGKSVKELALERGILGKEELEKLLKPDEVTAPRDIRKIRKKA